VNDDEFLQVVAERDALQARLDAYEGEVEAWEELDRLIADSSLGTPEAVALREQLPPEVSHAIARATEYLVRAEKAETQRDRLAEVLANMAECAHDANMDEPMCACPCHVAEDT
jgi:hypothetical protein